MRRPAATCIAAPPGPQLTHQPFALRPRLSLEQELKLEPSGETSLGLRERGPWNVLAKLTRRAMEHATLYDAGMSFRQGGTRMDRTAPLTDAEVKAIHDAIHVLNDPPSEVDATKTPEIARELQELLEARGLL